MAQKNLQTGASYKPLAENLDPRTATLRQIVEAQANTLSGDGKKGFISAFSGKTQFAPIFKEYLDRPAIDFVETFADDESNPLVKVYEKNEKVNARRDMYSRIGAIEFHIKDQLTRAGVLNDFFPEGMPMATDRVVRPDKPKAKARRYSYNPGLMGEWLTKLDEYGKNNPKDLGIVKALAAQAHMGLRTGEIMNAPASAFVPPEKRSASWGFFLDTDTPGVKMDENLNIAVGPRTYNILQQALDVSQANDRNLFVNPDGSPIGKGEMTRVAKLIKVPGIMTDELTGAKLDSIQEAYDLRRMWVTLALNEFPGQGDRVGAAQGRAIGAVTKGGGAVKEYYSPSRGFYGTEATAVPNAMDAWLFEAQTEELPTASRPPKGQRVSYSTDFITGGPVFEPADAPITMGSLTAKFVAPTPKTEVIRPEGPGIEPKQQVESDVFTSDPAVRAKLDEAGFDAKGMAGALKDFFSKGTIPKALTAAVGLELGRQLIEAPLETGGALAAELGMETVARAVGLASAPAAAVPMILAPTETAGPELSEMPPSQEDFIPAREVEEESPTEQMARIATEDAGFIERNREPEAAPVAQDQGFLQPQP